MKKLFFILSAIAVLAAPVSAQDVRTRLQQNPERYANVLHSYEAPEIVVDTPAPQGYTPFYVSHYGRHGSRYHVSMNPVTRVSTLFDSLDSLGLLSAEGREVHAALKTLEACHEDQAGYLTLRGGAEHQGISQRLYERVPGVFAQADRPRVVAESSPIQRCIQSLANFSLVLSGNAPELKFDIYAGERFMKHIAPGTTKPRAKEHYPVFDSVLAARFDPTRVMNAWFTDPWDAAQHLGKYDVRNFIYYVFYAGNICQCLAYDYPDIPDFYHFFTEEELYALWWAGDVSHYDSLANTVENGDRFSETGRPILLDIVEKADAAIAGNDVAADLRFGHDTGLMPLWSYLRVEGPGNEKPLPMAQAPEKGWYCFDEMPMASNLQMIFYRNGRGDVIVKVLRNEREVTFPALKPWKSPYYKWKDLRAYFLSLE